MRFRMAIRPVQLHHAPDPQPVDDRTSLPRRCSHPGKNPVPATLGEGQKAAEVHGPAVGVTLEHICGGHGIAFADRGGRCCSMRSAASLRLSCCAIAVTPLGMTPIAAGPPGAFRGAGPQSATRSAIVGSSHAQADHRDRAERPAAWPELRIKDADPSGLPPPLADHQRLQWPSASAPGQRQQTSAANLRFDGP